MQKFNELKEKGIIFSKKDIPSKVKEKKKPYYHIEYLEKADHNKIYNNIETLKSEIINGESVEIIDTVRLKADMEGKLYKVFLQDHNISEDEIFALTDISDNLEDVDKEALFGNGLTLILKLSYERV